jgi:hypothetical protein
MAMHFEHYQLSTRNIYQTAQKLREETGLGFYDGGYFTSGGIANKIFPLGECTYLEVEGVVDAGAVATDPGAKAFYDRSADGESFSLLSMRVDTLEEMQALAARFGATLAKSPTTRVRPNGPPVEAYSTPPGTHTGHGAVSGELATPERSGRVGWFYFPNLYLHPAGQPVFNWPGCVEPQGISFLEVGGTEQEMTEWLGQPASNFPYRFNGKPQGLYAIGVKTSKGEVVIRRPWRQ